MDGPERIERLVRTWMASGRDQDVDETITVISSGQGSLLNVVKTLGEYLTSEEDELRTKGVEFMSAILSGCPPEHFNRQSVKVLTSFLCGKLDDLETVVPALKGLASLTYLPTFTSDDAVDVVNALLMHVKMKSLVQSQRFIVLTIIDNLISKHRDALKNISKHFVPGYISLVNGEKDPRNLILCFAIDRVLLLEFEVKNYIEDFFNITFCYFPITFRPPPDDPYGVTTDDLKKALRSCLNATPDFGPLGIPLFLEKLTAGSPMTKRDTFQTLVSCLPVYGAITAGSFAKKLWNCLRLEIFQATDSETEEEALKTVQALVNVIYADRDSADIPGLVKDVCHECLDLLKEPEKSQAKPAMKTLCAFLSTTNSVSRYTLGCALPHLTAIFHNPDEASNRTPTLTLLCELIIAARDSTPDSSPDVKLAAFKDDLLGIMTVGLKNESSCAAALDGLKALVTTSGLVTNDELGYVVHNVNEVIAEEWANAEEISDTILGLLSTISAHSPTHVEGTTLPLLFGALPDQAPARGAAPERAKCWQTLAFLAKLCKQPTLFETLVVRLTTKLDMICGSTTHPQEDVEPNAAYVHSILLTLRNVLEEKVDLDHTDVPKYLDRLVCRLFNLFAFSVLQPAALHMVASEPRLLKTTGEIITFVVQVTPVAKQQVFVRSLVDAYLNGNVKGLAVGSLKLPEDQVFHPFEPSASLFQKNMIVLFSAAVIALHKEIPVPVQDTSSFLQSLYTWSVQHAESSLQREAAWHAIASILNKRSDDSIVFLTTCQEQIWSTQISNGAPGRSVPDRRYSISAWTWVTKALTTKGHAASEAFVDRLFEVFDDTDINWDAAKAIGDIVASDDILTKKKHAAIRILFAQRYCSRLLPRIVEGAKGTGNNRQQVAYLVALTSLIKSVPKSTYAPEMTTLIPLLLRGLQLRDSDIRVNVISTLHAATDSDTNGSNILAEHVGTLVTAMLENSKVQEMPSFRVRVAALRYLGVLPKSIRYDKLHPYKTTVIKELSKVLDDPKRAVRKEAVDTRSNWFTCSG
ncbi:ARM repeat-containing protein [Neolentinus lepideus HHB14362 ss-1]|uniref:MMS19 nucleotide excision repair protein n=1 Tax=Neolentinus lepideus HHB14362 ss-1 TaxID=1314782 RepID=A0A165SJE9_9AGAM|nr:ARM repeat-containing protein [Neolentinus lepideus HHB14362 ss-1]